jgi:polyhydroxybutyrate depolymerase
MMLLALGCRTQPQVKPGVTPIAAPRMPSGTYTLMHGARARRYILHLPAGKEYEDNLPVVFAFHGAPGNAANLEQNSLLSAKADSAGFIALYPDGTSLNDPVFLNWNSGSCCGYAWENKIDDLGFLRLLIDRIEAEYHISRKRIYAAGFSKGGMMVHRLGCEASDLFSGIADIGGALNLPNCKPARGVDVLLIHGRNDASVKFGGPLPKKIPPLADYEDRPVAYAVEIWQKNNHCSPGKNTVAGTIEQTDFICTRAALRLIAIAGEGHTWPGGLPGMIGSEKPTQAFSANDAMWDFWQEAAKKRRKRGGKAAH